MGGGGGRDDDDNRIHRMAMDDPVAWYKKPNLRRMYFLLFPCVIGIEMTSGFDSQIINSAQLLPAWKEYFGHPTGAYNGILASALPLGSVIGLPFIPLVNDNLGRRWCIWLGSVVMICGVIIQGLSINGPMYIMARGIIGFGLPYAIVAGSCLISELGYPKERPILTSLFNACYFIGAIVAAGVTFGVQKLQNDWSWRIPSFLQMAPSLLQVTFVFFLPESPRFLMSKDKIEEAEAVLIKYHAEGNAESEFVRAEILEIKTTLQIEMENAKRSWMDMVRTPGNRRRLLIGSLLGLFTQLSGNLVISYFLGDVLQLIGYTDPTFQAQYNLGNQCWSLVCGVGVALVVMRFRRRTMYMTGILSILAVYVAWTTCTAVFIVYHSEVAAKLCLFFIYAYSPAYNLAFNALTYTYLVEIFPYAQRARGIAIFQFWGKAAQFFGTNVNPIGTGAIGWKFLLVYCCWILVEAVLIWFLWPETSDRSLEELAFLFEQDEYARRHEKVGVEELEEKDTAHVVETQSRV
ncbi:general substrate transporter [Chaetomium sp. MPI-CAGE-AT-0009]|nr:general substrate transporter [Chaetomium sp. MPI-CAGE-AT-0009]